MPLAIIVAAQGTVTPKMKGSSVCTHKTTEYFTHSDGLHNKVIVRFFYLFIFFSGAFIIYISANPVVDITETSPYKSNPRFARNI